MNSEDDSLISQEVEALKAIYGDESISFQDRESPNSTAKIAISLESLLSQSHVAGQEITLSICLPLGYPTTKRPEPPTLRSHALSSASAARLVTQMLDNVYASVGEVCLFQYIQGIISILEAIPSENQRSNDGTAKASGSTEAVEGRPCDQFEIFHGEPLTDRKSVFQAHIAKVKSVDDVNAVLRQLKASNRKISTATHNMLAYRIAEGDSIHQDMDDDGEQGAGKNVMFILRQMDAINVVCVVSRWYGGIKLGPARFKHICKVTRDLVELRRPELSLKLI